MDVFIDISDKISGKDAPKHKREFLKKPLKMGKCLG